MSFLSRESRHRLGMDIALLRCTLPRPISKFAIEDSSGMLSSSVSMGHVQRERVATTLLKLVNENQQLRTIVCTTNMGVERISTHLRDGNASKKRSPSSPFHTRKSKRQRCM